MTCGVDGLQDFVLFGLVFSHSFHVRFEIIARTHMVGLPCRTVISFESVLIEGVFEPIRYADQVISLVLVCKPVPAFSSMK